MLERDIPNHPVPWEGGALFHDNVNDNYLIVRFGNGTNDPNEDYEDEPEPFDDYLICEMFYDGGKFRRTGIDSAESDDGVMIPIHRRDQESGQIRDWAHHALRTAGFDPLITNFVSLVE